MSDSDTEKGGAIEFMDGLARMRICKRNEAGMSFTATPADLIAALQASQPLFDAVLAPFERESAGITAVATQRYAELQSRLTTAQARIAELEHDAGRMHYLGNMLGQKTQAEWDELSALMRKHPARKDPQANPPPALASERVQGPGEQSYLAADRDLWRRQAEALEAEREALQNERGELINMLHECADLFDARGHHGLAKQYRPVASALRTEQAAGKEDSSPSGQKGNDHESGHRSDCEVRDGRGRAGSGLHNAADGGAVRAAAADEPARASQAGGAMASGAEEAGQVASPTPGAPAQCTCGAPDTRDYHLRSCPQHPAYDVTPQYEDPPAQGEARCEVTEGTFAGARRCVLRLGHSGPYHRWEGLLPSPAKPDLPGGYGPAEALRKQIVEALRSVTSAHMRTFHELADKLEARGGR